MGRSRIVPIGGFQHVDGACYMALLEAGIPPGDTSDNPFASNLDVLEDGEGLGAPHALHDLIAKQGRGLFSHWHDVVYFSTSDNSDPRTNGRRYSVYTPDKVSGRTDHAAHFLSSLPENFAPAQAYAAIERALAVLYPEAKLGEDCKAFWRDDAFIEDYRRLTGENFRALERKYTVRSLLRAVAHVPGDLAECGVYNGSTAFFMASAARDAGLSRNFFLYDSFEGLSRPRPEDGAYWREGDLSVSEELARRNLAGFTNLHFRRGWIPERFGEDASRKFCFVHIDVDLYQPTLDSIAFFYPRLQPGGMLVCDDYGFTSCPGAMKAMDEFFAENAERIIHLPTGQGLVVKL